MKNFCLCQKVLYNTVWFIVLVLVWMMCTTIVWKVINIIFDCIENNFGAKVCTAVVYTSIVIAGYYSSRIARTLNKEEK